MTYALGIENAKPRAALLAHLLQWSAGPGRPRLLLEVKDPDEQMRAVKAECFKLGWATLSCRRGYYYARPGVYRDWAGHKRLILKILIAHHRTLQQLKFVREHEGRRQAILSALKTKRWPPGHQMDILEQIREAVA